MQYLQQSLTNRNDFAKVDEESRATHFIGNDGKIRVLATNELVQNVPQQTHNEEPLLVPTMNFGGDDKKEVKTNRSSGEQPLVLPQMFKN